MSQSNYCKNCSKELAGLYCPNCGQKDTKLLSLKEIVKEFAGNVFSFDSRFFISLKFLITKPGFLTIEYWEGKRTRYLPPLRMYLVLSILYFFLTPLMDTDVYEESLINTQEDGVSVPVEIKIDEHWHKVFHVYADIMNEGFIQIFDNPLTEGNLLFAYFPSAMFVVMPFMGFILFFLYRKKKLLFAHHVITILHFNAFVFLTLIIENVLQKVLPENTFSDFTDLWIFLLFKLFLMGYLFLLLKRVYQNSWIKSFFKFIITFIIFTIIILLSMIVLIFGKIFLLGLFA